MIITLDDCNAFKETAYLLKSPANAKRLRDSIAQIEATETTCHKLSIE
ncbi:type II toxin-antitoxin system Phd/YefM family antitoxin [Acinetobacter sp. YH12205]